MTRHDETRHDTVRCDAMRAQQWRYACVLELEPPRSRGLLSVPKSGTIRRSRDLSIRLVGRVSPRNYPVNYGYGYIEANLATRRAGRRGTFHMVGAWGPEPRPPGGKLHVDDDMGQGHGHMARHHRPSPINSRGTRQVVGAGVGAGACPVARGSAATHALWHLGRSSLASV